MCVREIIVFKHSFLLIERLGCVVPSPGHAIRLALTRAVATIGAWGAIAPPHQFLLPPPHQTFGKLKFTIENFNYLMVIN